MEREGTPTTPPPARACMASPASEAGGFAGFAARQYRDPSPATCHAALVLVQALFAGMHTTASPALEHIPPFGFCALRLAIALPFLWYLSRREGGRAFRGAEWLHPIPMGVAIGTAYALVFVCNKRSGPILTAMIQPLMPISTTVLSALAGLERVGAGKALGLLIATLGTIITLRVFTETYGKRPSAVDAVLLVMQANAYAVYVVCLAGALRLGRADAEKEEEARGIPGVELEAVEEDAGASAAAEGTLKLGGGGAAGRGVGRVPSVPSSPPGPMRYLFYSTLVAEVIIVGVGAEGLGRDVSWDSLPAEAIAGVLYAGFASSCLAHGLNSWAVSKVAGILPTVYSGVQVIFTVLFAGVFLGEAVGWDRACGSAVTVFGVYLVSRAKEREMEREKSEGGDAGERRVGEPPGALERAGAKEQQGGQAAGEGTRRVSVDLGVAVRI